MKENFLLHSPLAEELYASVRDLPIIDYHNHLDHKAILQDQSFENLTQLWIASDPYKHRAMRILGVPERLITGEASDREKFDAWYACLPKLIGNVLYPWSEMEMKTVFGIDLFCEGQTADAVWQTANERLRTMSAHAILSLFPIEYLAPCATFLDDVSAYEKKERFAPSLRGDDAVLPTKAFLEQTGRPIQTLSDYLSYLRERISDFARAGCRYADHALDSGFSYRSDDGGNDARFERIVKGESLSEADAVCLRSYLLCALARIYAEVGFVMQLHIGARRQTSSRLLRVAGPAGGYAAIGNTVDVDSLTRFLDDAESGEYGLCKTLLFNLNPADNAVFATLCGSYSKNGVPAVVSQGPAWWWCDHKTGICQMLESFAAYGVLSVFNGMTTDSRSLLSLVRHDYFRRIVCDFVAERVHTGDFCDRKELLFDLVRALCYENAKQTLS